MISDFALPVGVVALLQFYWRLKSEPEMGLGHKVTPKLISLKAIIFINFIQELAFDIATSQHAFKPTKTITFKDFSIGIPNMLICFEQCLVAGMYHWSFSAKEYQALSKVSSDKLNIFQAAASALNPTDLIMGFVYAIKLLMSGVGPKGNGTWRRDGGYGKVKMTDQQEMQAPLAQYGNGPGYANGPAPRYESSPAPTDRSGYTNGPVYDSSYGYDHTRDGDVEHGDQHVLLPTQTPPGQSWA